MAQQPEVHKLLGFPIRHLSSEGAQIHSFLPLNISGYAFAPKIYWYLPLEYMSIQFGGVSSKFNCNSITIFF
ncbi:hypothetical protein IMY05_005G0080400 [Salix suchowensis]|nr:hypothetical protein IMY05_005G0080400 [Salix suchowensis]